MAKTPKKDSKYIDFSTQDEVVKQAISDIQRAKNCFDTHRSDHAKLRKAFDKTFEIGDINIGDNSTKPDIYRSGLGRNQTEIAAEAIKAPSVEIKSVLNLPGLEIINDLDEEDAKKFAEEISNANIAKAVYEWCVREGKQQGVDNQGRENWIGMGDNFNRPYHRTSKSGRKMFQFENLKPALVILDPDGESIDSADPVKECQFAYYVYVLTEEMVITMYGKEILPYIEQGGPVFETTDLLGKQEVSQGAKYYLLFSGQNKAREFDVDFLGAGAFPVRRHSEEPLPKKLTEAVIKDSKADIREKYLYIDSYGNPYINMSQFFCFFRESSPYNYGIQQKVYRIQALDEAVENGKADSFRRSLEEINYVSGIREVQLDQVFEKFKQKKMQDIRAMMPIPSSYGQQPPTVGTIKFSEINPLSAQATTDNVARLARNAVGVDPNRLEVQKTEGLGIRELLQEEKTKIVQKIADDNIICYERRVEKVINYIVVHEGLDLDRVLIEYEGIEKSSSEGVLFPMKKTISISKAAEKLKDWNYQVIVSVDDVIKKSNAIVSEKIFSMLERTDPNAYPELYKKLMMKLNETTQLNISSEDLIQQAPAKAMGGASQFQSNGGGGEQPPANVGGVQPADPFAQANASAIANPEVGTV